MKKLIFMMFLLVFSLTIVGCLPSVIPPTEENQAPIIVSTPTYIAKIGVEYIYDVKGFDLDGDSLIYSLVINPVNMSINQFTGVISWTPEIVYGQVGDNSVIVKVSDGELDDVQSIVIKVNEPPVNHAPVIYSTPETTATVGDVYSYDVNASDPDGDVLTYGLWCKPEGMLINLCTGEIMWIPECAGIYKVIVRVLDGEKAAAYQTFIINVE